MDKFRKYTFWAAVSSAAILLIISFWPSSWWLSDTGSNEIPTVPTKSKELTWNGYDPLVVAESVEPGEWISMNLERRNANNKISVSYGAESNGKRLTTHMFGPEGYVIKENKKYYKYRPFQYDNKGRKIAPLAVVAVLTTDVSKWWSTPLSVVSWTKGEEFDVKDVCKNNLNQTLTCILVLNQPVGYRQTPGLVDNNYTMTFLTTKHVVVSRAY